MNKLVLLLLFAFSLSLSLSVDGRKIKPTPTKTQSTSSPTTSAPRANVYSTAQFDTLSFRLVIAAQKYRKQLGLPHIPVSPSMMRLAAAHVEDLTANFDKLKSSSCDSPYSWSFDNEEMFSGCCVNKKNISISDCGDDFKAAEITPIYDGFAKEIVITYDPTIISKNSKNEIDIEKVLDLIIKDSTAFTVLTNDKSFRFTDFKAIGGAVTQRFASIWFGTTEDDAEWSDKSDNMPSSDAPKIEGDILPCDYLDGRDEGAALVEMLSTFRTQQNISSIPISPSLMEVARAHVRDLHAKYYNRAETLKGCSELSWFNSTFSNGFFCCVKKGVKGEESPCVHQRPKEMIGYVGDSYELVYVDKNPNAQLEPIDILSKLIKNPLYNAVIFNLRFSAEADFSFVKWLAAGAAVKGGVASIWIGDSDDLNECDDNDEANLIKDDDDDDDSDDDDDQVSTAAPTRPAAVYQHYDFDEPAYSLAKLVNDLRTKSGLAPIPLSPSLFAVAELHVQDLVNTEDDMSNDDKCDSLLSWSPTALWDECCISKASPKYECTQSKPSEIFKDYSGKAVELIAKVSENVSPANAIKILTSRKNHKDLLMSTKWTGIGAEIENGYISIWLGSGQDKATWAPKSTKSTSVKAQKK